MTQGFALRCVATRSAYKMIWMATQRMNRKNFYSSVASPSKSFHMHFRSQCNAAQTLRHIINHPLYVTQKFQNFSHRVIPVTSLYVVLTGQVKCFNELWHPGPNLQLLPILFLLYGYLKRLLAGKQDPIDKRCEPHLSHTFLQLKVVLRAALSNV